MLGPPPEGPGGCLGKVFRSILEDNGSKMVFFGCSCEMLRHLGAKMGNNIAKMGQDSPNEHFGVPRGVGALQPHASKIRIPLKNSKCGAWSLELGAWSLEPEGWSLELGWTFRTRLEHV